MSLPACYARSGSTLAPTADVHLGGRIHLRALVQEVMDGRDALLAVAMNGKPLPIAYGFPVRVVVLL